jgi:putative flippase GtrA/SAM-dependent methyltransferase
MFTGSAVRSSPPSKLARFAAVGSIGFLIDASILTLLVNGVSFGHYSARAISFPLAVTATWYGNRRWVFEPTVRMSAEYARYFSVQIAGAVLNLGIYVVVIELVPSLAVWPVVPLAVGAAAGLCFNFVMSRAFVFRASRDGADMPRPANAAALDTDTGRYSGTDNLDAMEHAVNYNRHLLETLRRHARDGTLLDFGAGTGTFARQAAGDAQKLVCVEPDASLRERLESAGLDCVADLSAVADRSIDFAYSFNVLEHIEDDLAALVALERCLKSDGRLLLYVPAFDLLYSPMDAKVGHFRRYRRGGLADKLEQAGFRVDLARYADSLGFFVTLVYKAVGDRSGTLDPRAVGIYDRWLFPLSRLLDRVLGGLVGKNLLVVAEPKPST